MAVQSSSQNNNSNGKKSIMKIKPFHFFLGFIAISTIIAFILGGYFIGKSKNSEKQNSPTASFNKIPDNPNYWTVYRLSKAGLELKLPEKLTKLGEWKESEEPGNIGSKIYFGKPQSNILVIGGTSIYFQEGRESRFTDLQGFLKEDGTFYAIQIGGKKLSLRETRHSEFENDNGVKIVKVLGENYKEGQAKGQPVPGTPGEGYLGAIINTENLRYPGLSIQLKLNEGISEYEFDQILRSIRFIN